MPTQRTRVDRLLDRRLTDREVQRLAVEHPEDWEDDVGLGDRECASIVRAWRLRGQVERDAANGGVHSPGELERVQAVALARWAIASEDAGVVEFRERVLGGRCLPMEEVRGLSSEQPGYSIPEMQKKDRERLDFLARRLAKVHGWTVEQGIAYVLTDAVPVPAPVRVTTRVGSPGTAHRIVLDVDPDTPPDDVVRAFMAARTEMHDGQRRRRRDPRTYNVLSFWLVHGRKDYAATARLWNREHPSGADDYNARTIRTTIQRGWTQVTGLGLPPAGSGVEG